MLIQFGQLLSGFEIRSSHRKNTELQAPL